MKHLLTLCLHLQRRPNLLSKTSNVALEKENRKKRWTMAVCLSKEHRHLRKLCPKGLAEQRFCDQGAVGPETDAVIPALTGTNSGTLGNFLPSLCLSFRPCETGVRRAPVGATLWIRCVHPYSWHRVSTSRTVAFITVKVFVK